MSIQTITYVGNSGKIVWDLPVGISEMLTDWDKEIREATLDTLGALMDEFAVTIMGTLHLEEEMPDYMEFFLNVIKKARRDAANSLQE